MLKKPYAQIADPSRRFLLLKLRKNIRGKNAQEPEKTPLRLVAPTPPDPAAPPTDLGESGATLWRAIMSEYRVDDAPRRQMLLQICYAADIAETARERGLLKDELAARAFVTRGLHRLNFDVEPTRERAGRPPGHKLTR